MDFSDVSLLFKEDLSRVEESIRENYKSEVTLIPGISGYLMDGGGKRFRPLLLLLSARLCGREADEQVIRHACVVEYIHAATLLHDDVVDETTLRRGRETVNSKWGSDASILVGDFLLSRAILLMAMNSDSKVMQAVSEAAKILVEGGILEYTHARKLGITLEHCLDVIYRKTASLISVSARVGAILGSAESEAEKALVSYGDHIGMAFQLVDDVMDYDGDEDTLGKAPGTDFKEGHVTLPLLHLYQNSPETLQQQIGEFIQNPNLTERELEYVIDRMRETRSLEYTLDLARNHIENAKLSLQGIAFKNPEYVEALKIMADHILERHTISKPCP